jgi:hypothetical protein
MRFWDLRSIWKAALLVVSILLMAFLLGHSILVSDTPMSPHINPASPTGR